LGLIIGVPVGEFADNVEVAGGLSGYLDVGLRRGPISLGGEATYLWYGEQTRDVPLSGIPDLSVHVTTSNEIFLLHGRVRAQRRGGRVRPYADGLAGFIDLVTRTSVDAKLSCSGGSEYPYCSNGGDSMTNLRDFAPSIGVGGGVMVAFGAPPCSARLDVSVRYFYGGEARYLTDSFIPFADVPASELARRSRTDMVAVYIGVAFGR
jgi:hypothetical protein